MSQRHLKREEALRRSPPVSPTAAQSAAQSQLRCGGDDDGVEEHRIPAAAPASATLPTATATSKAVRNRFANMKCTEAASGCATAVVSSAASTRSKVKPQRYDVILVLDFEATCERDATDWPHEIIELPCVAVDCRTPTPRVIGEFQTYVKPTRNPKLTDFCTELTGITQAQVDAAPTLPEALAKFEKWRAETIVGGGDGGDGGDGGASASAPVQVLACDGPWDVRRFVFEHSMVRDGVTFPSLFFTFVNVRAEYSAFFKCKPLNLGQQLARLNMVFEGRQHSGIDDTRNIARIVRSLIARGHRFSGPNRLGGTREEMRLLERAAGRIRKSLPPANGLEKSLLGTLRSEGEKVIDDLLNA